MLDTVYLIVIPIACVLVFLLIIYMVTDSGPDGKIDLTDPKTHVVITGGSSGIGLATATMLRQKGCSVSIIARDEKKLADAKAEIDSKTAGCGGELHTASGDVSNLEQIQSVISSCCAKFGNRVDVLIASAGISRPGLLEEVEIGMYERMMRINYLGSLYATLAVIPLMKKQKFGRLVYVSSLSGLTSMIGFAGYAASKFAVRGFAESVQMEFKPYNIYVSLVNPPDVDTPMLKEEMQWKPEETKILSADGGLFSAEDLAADIVSSIRSWRFMVNTGFDGWLLGLASTSLSTPCPTVMRALVEIFMSSILRFVALFYLTSWNSVCKTEYEKREKKLASRT